MKRYVGKASYYFPPVGTEVTSNNRIVVVISEPKRASVLFCTDANTT
jgi:hypothetical protein